MTLETGMLIAFVLALIISLWKVYAFLPNKPLEDDDRTDEIDTLLHAIMIDTIVKHGSDLSVNELFDKMKEHHAFDHKRLWRFNVNRLNHLLREHQLRYPDQESIVEIYRYHKYAKMPQQSE